MRIKSFLFAILAVSLLAFLNSCGVSKEMKWKSPVLNTIWQLESIAGFTTEDGIRKQPTLAFEGQNEYGGFSGCNNYFGTFEITGPNKIKFNEGGMTMMACQPGMNTENAFIDMLRKVDGFQVKGARMELLQGDIPVAFFTVVENLED